MQSGPCGGMNKTSLWQDVAIRQGADCRQQPRVSGPACLSSPYDHRARFPCCVSLRFSFLVWNWASLVFGCSVTFSRIKESPDIKFYKNHLVNVFSAHITRTQHFKSGCLLTPEAFDT